MSLPTITFEYDREFAELTVEAVDGGFCGVARAVVTGADVEEIARFIVRLRTYPLETCSLTLACADLVKLTALQIDTVGRIILVAEIGEGTRLEHKIMRISIRQDWEALSRFSAELSRMIRGGLDRIELRGEAG